MCEMVALRSDCDRSSSEPASLSDDDPDGFRRAARSPTRGFEDASQCAASAEMDAILGRQEVDCGRIRFESLLMPRLSARWMGRSIREAVHVKARWRQVREYRSGAEKNRLIYAS